ncbi:unnamed protein product [Soboliphyme baturini]|uniref:Zinc transporter ZIP1 n=1 Tax=Soboliphyme baturini TaxID=241478 RepID=A0A183J6V2_9BILA|nr:unnamed protein product [Soboliphyme baturini]
MAFRVLKIILICVLLVVSVVCSLVPIVLRCVASRARSIRVRNALRTVMGLASCYGGGVFLATGLLDLLPDTREEIGEGLKIAGYRNVEFPLAEFFVVMGFCVVLCTEQIILHFRYVLEVTRVQLSSSSSSIVAADDQCPPLSESQSSLFHKPRPTSSSLLRVGLLVVSLSLHALFEGLALGLVTQYSLALQIFAALCIHKGIISVSLGLNLASCQVTTVLYVTCCLCFALSGAVGGFIGVTVVDAVRSSASRLVSGFLQGTACGTFFYIVAFEILPHELEEDQRQKLPKLIFFILGLSTICLILRVGDCYHFHLDWYTSQAFAAWFRAYRLSYTSS